MIDVMGESIRLELGKQLEQQTDSDNPTPEFVAIFKLNDRVIAKDHFGNFRNEPGKVIGFETNLLGQPLVIVRLDVGSDRGTCFYEEELKHRHLIGVSQN